MKTEYQVELWEDKIEKNRSGQIIHHPLNGPYRSSTGEDMPSYGHLTFGGHGLAESPLLGDVKVFYLEFFGEYASVQDREAWADPLRVKVLQRLSHKNRAWYLSCVGTYLNTSSLNEYRPIVKELREDFFGGQPPSFTVVRSEKVYGYGKGFHSRFFFEVPNRFLPSIVLHYWPRAIPGWPMEGYNMASGQIEALREWDKRPRDDQLFRDVMDQVFVAFYTCPAEHRHFVFVTNKLDLDDLKQLLDLESLQQQAKEIGSRTKP